MVIEVRKQEQVGYGPNASTVTKTLYIGTNKDKAFAIAALEELHVVGPYKPYIVISDYSEKEHQKLWNDAYGK